MHIEESQLKTFILDSGLVSRADVDLAEKDVNGANDSIGKILVNKGKLTEDDLRRMQAYILGMPFVDLKGEKLPFEVLSLIPEPIARNHNIVAFKKTETSLEVAMLDTEDLTAIDFIKKKTGLKILPRLTDADSMKSAILQYQKSLKAEFGDLIAEDVSSLKNIPVDNTDGELSGDDLKKLAEDVPVVRIVDTLLKHAILQNASDIHIEPQENELLIRYRLDGLLHDAMILPKNMASSIAARLKVLSSLKLDEKRLPQDGRFKIDSNGEKVSFRVSSLPTYYGEKIVMRLLRENVSGFTLEHLSFHGDGLERIHRAVKSTTGMILTTGPTGSGKTTTLYTILDMLNTPDVNISTIEDPIEYQMKRINQTQVRPEIGFTFSSGLRTLVRQDPDIIMVGEIRDNETASLAVNASLTGHVVLSTLHTNSAAGAVPRLMDMKVEPFLIVSTINIIIGQRLVRKLTDQKEKYLLTKAELTTLGKSVNMDKLLKVLKEEKVIGATDDWSKVNFWRVKKGANHDDAFSGRIGIHEIMKVSPAIKEIILKSGTADAIQEVAESEGMLTMIEDGIFQAVVGLTTIEEVLRAISE
ncbi:type II/IV secretion system protein [Patescibacteria group bacterium]|nr:type II/IV secretion system protein [Patescibacteria group bacterium]